METPDETAGLKQSWLQKRAPNLHAALSAPPAPSGADVALGAEQGQSGALYENPEDVAGRYNLGDLVRLYSAG